MVGTQWRLTSIDGIAPVGQRGATLTFGQTRFNASVGCNTIGGDYRIEARRMITKSVLATQMFCEGPVWNQELAVIALLAGAPAIKRQGQQLRLESAGHSLEAEASAN